MAPRPRSGWFREPVAPALESCPGGDSICLDLCLNLNPVHWPPSPRLSPPFFSSHSILPPPPPPPSSSSFLVLSHWAPRGRGSPTAEHSPVRRRPLALRRLQLEPGPGAEGTAGIATSSPELAGTSAAGGQPGEHGGTGTRPGVRGAQAPLCRQPSHPAQGALSYPPLPRSSGGANVGCPAPQFANSGGLTIASPTWQKLWTGRGWARRDFRGRREGPFQGPRCLGWVLFFRVRKSWCIGL